MINSRRSQTMVTILLNSGEVLLPGDILDKVQHPQGRGGGLGGEMEGTGGNGQLRNPVFENTLLAV